MISVQKIFDKTLGKKWVQILVLVLACLIFYVLPILSTTVSKESLGTLILTGLMIVFCFDYAKNTLISGSLFLITIVGLPVLLYSKRKLILSRVTALNATIILVIAFSITGFLWHTIHMASKIPGSPL